MMSTAPNVPSGRLWMKSTTARRNRRAVVSSRYRRRASSSALWVGTRAGVCGGGAPA